jgi:hypothetical protein
MSVEALSIDKSNADLIVALESSPGTLPGSPVWVRYPIRSFSGSFGGTNELLAQRVISKRNRLKAGDIVGAAVDGSHDIYATPTVLDFLAPRILHTAGDAVPQGGGVFDSGLAVVSTGYDLGTAAAGAGFVDGHLVYAENFATAANNGLKEVTGTASDVVQASGLTAEASPPAGAIIRVVGIQFGTSELDVVKDVNQYPNLTIASGTLDWEDFPECAPGRWIKIGGSATADKFTAAANNGYARILSRTASVLTLDRAPGGADGETDMSDETGTSKTIKIWFASQYKDEQLDDAKYAKTTSRFVRRLGAANPTSGPTDIQAEELEACTWIGTTIGVTAQAEVTVSFNVIGTDFSSFTGISTDVDSADGATITDIPDSEFLTAGRYLTVSNLAAVADSSTGNAAPDLLTNKVTDWTIAIDNQGSVLTATGEDTGFDVSINEAAVTVGIEPYFTDIASKIGIGANTTYQLQLGWQRSFNGRTAGMLLDFPRGKLGQGQVTVPDQGALKQSLNLSCFDDTDHDMTMSINTFWYVENA